MSKRSHDDVNLLHWVKSVEGDYRFARFNKSIKVRAWGEGEYERWLYDPDWTLEETETLFALCRAYDLRFVVIQDRYNSVAEEKRAEGGKVKEEPPPTQEPTTSPSTAPPMALPVASSDVPPSSPPPPLSLSSPPPQSLPSPPTGSSPSSIWRDRSVEELKGRYYSIQCKLLQLHNSSDPDLKKHPLFTSSYDEAYEKKRKSLLSQLYHRSVRETDDMAGAVLEHRKVVAALKRMKAAAKAEREGKRGEGGAGGASHKKKRREKGGAAPPAPIPDSQLAPIPSDLIPSLPPLTSPQPFLRSTQLAHTLSSLPPRLLRQVEGELTLLQVKRPSQMIPTGPVLELYEQLRQAVMVLRGLEGLCDAREGVRDELREEERKKGVGSGSGGGGEGRGEGEGRVKKEKGKKDRKESGGGGSDRGDRGDEEGEREKSSGGGSHKKKDKRKGSEGEERDSKRRKK